MKTLKKVVAIYYAEEEKIFAGKPYEDRYLVIELEDGTKLSQGQCQDSCVQSWSEIKVS